MKKTPKKPAKRRNLVAKALADPALKAKTVPPKKGKGTPYKRQKNRRPSDSEDGEFCINSTK